MKDLLTLLRETEYARGQYAAWACEDASSAQTARDQGETHHARILDNRAADYRRRAEGEGKRAEEYAERLMRQFGNVQAHSFHRVHQPHEYALKDAAE